MAVRAGNGLRDGGDEGAEESGSWRGRVRAEMLRRREEKRDPR